MAKTKELYQETAELRSAIKKLNLSRKWSACQSNSIKLKNYLKKGSVERPVMMVNGGLEQSHVFYVDEDERFVVDMVIKSNPHYYKYVRDCEFGDGLFDKDCYYRAFSIGEY